MKVVILAGGLGTRISEETHLRPKPMITIGDMPILWHIMKGYGDQGFKEFIICGGYKCEVIKDFFNNYFLYTSDVTFDLKNEKAKFFNANNENWNVTVVNTGLSTQTGGRLKRVSHLLSDDEPFFFTYGDGLSNVDFKQELEFHNAHNGIATVLGVRPPARYGALSVKDGLVESFKEKPVNEVNGLINGGFLVLDKKVIEYINGDECSFEIDQLPALAHAKQLFSFRHDGFWQAMDTLRDLHLLRKDWDSGEKPWKLKGRPDIKRKIEQ